MKLNKENKYNGKLSSSLIKKTISLGLLGTMALSLNACSNDKTVDNFTYNINPDTGIVEVTGTLPSEEIFNMKVIKTTDIYDNEKLYLANFVNGKSGLFNCVYVLVENGTYYNSGMFVWKKGEKTELGTFVESTYFREYLIAYDKLQPSYTYDDVMKVWNKVKEDAKLNEKSNEETTKVLIKE